MPDIGGRTVEVTLRIKRYNPDTDVKPSFREYSVEVEPTDRVLDALNQLQGETAPAPESGSPAADPALAVPAAPATDAAPSTEAQPGTTTPPAAPTN